MTKLTLDEKTEALGLGLSYQQVTDGKASGLGVRETAMAVGMRVSFESFAAHKRPEKSPDEVAYERQKITSGMAAGAGALSSETKAALEELAQKERDDG